MKEEIAGILKQAASGEMTEEECARAFVRLMQFADSMKIGMGMFGPGLAVGNQTLAGALK